MIYVALLRGINVGGNNKVDMKKLITTFEMLGFKNVDTYINSGNIIFEEIINDEKIIEKQIEQAIIKDFQLDLKVLVKNINNFETICKALPDNWVKNEFMRTDVLFLWEEFDSSEIIDKLNAKSVDNVKYVPGAILWNILGENYSKSGLNKLIGTELYRNMTIRNVNTVRKIFQMMIKKN